jgi:hypothetical protein
MEFPAIEAHEELTRLSEGAASLAHELKLMRSPYGLIDHDALTAKLREFYRKVESRSHIVGRNRALRVLRLGVPAVRGIDPNRGTKPDLEDAILWAEGVFQNIDTELRKIDSGRILWLSFMATVAALVSAFAVIYQIMSKS